MLRSRSDSGTGVPLVVVLICTFLLCGSQGCEQKKPISSVEWPQRVVTTDTSQAVRSDLERLAYRPGLFNVTWTEGGLTDYVRSLLSSAERFTLWCEPDALYIEINLAILGNRQISLAALPEISDGTLHISVMHLRIGERPLPFWLRLLVQNTVNDVIHDSLGSYHLNQVTLGQGWLQISGNVS